MAEWLENLQTGGPPSADMGGLHREAQLALMRMQRSPGELRWSVDWLSRRPPGEYQQILSQIMSYQGVPASLKAQFERELEAKRQDFLASPEGQQYGTAGAIGGITGAIGATAPGLIQGQFPELTPQMKAQLEQQYDLIRGELQRRRAQGETDIVESLARRGMGRSSLYGQGLSELERGYMQQLAQLPVQKAQEGRNIQAQAMGLGMGMASPLFGYQTNLLGLKQQKELARQQQENQMWGGLLNLGGLF